MAELKEREQHVDNLLDRVNSVCQTDAELKRAIKALRRKLSNRQHKRRYERLRKIGRELKPDERVALLAAHAVGKKTTHYRLPANIDPELLERLRAKKLATTEYKMLSHLGMNVAYVHPPLTEETAAR
jgi:hypothetical protein